MEKSSLRLNRQPSFSYAAAEPDQKDPEHLLKLVESALDNAPQDPETANKGPKVLYQKLSRDDRPFLTTNPNSKEQQWTERNTDRYPDQQKAATEQARKLGQFWFNNSKSNSDTYHAADALFRLSTSADVQSGGLACTRQLQGLLKILNEAHKAGKANPPQQLSPRTTRGSNFQLPSLSPRQWMAPPLDNPPTLQAPPQRHKGGTEPVHSLRKTVITPRHPMGGEPERREFDRPEEPSSTRQFPVKPFPTPPIPRHRTTASLDSETETESSKQEDSPTKGSPDKHRSPRAGQLQKRRNKDLSQVRAAARQQQTLGDLQDLFFPPDIGAVPVVQNIPHHDTSSVEPSPKDPASDRPKASGKTPEPDDTPIKAHSISTIPPLQRALSTQPRPRPSIWKKPETPPATPTSAQ